MVADLYVPDNSIDGILVILPGGVIQGKNHPLYGYLAKTVCEKGYAVLVLNFSGFGDSLPRSGLYFDPNCNIEDAITALQYIEQKFHCTKEDISLLGHSGGANIAAAIVTPNTGYRRILLLSPAEFSTIYQSNKEIDYWHKILAKESVSKEYVKIALEKMVISVFNLPDYKSVIIFGEKENKLITNFSHQLAKNINAGIRIFILPKADHFYGFWAHKPHFMKQFVKRLVHKQPQKRLAELILTELNSTVFSRQRKISL